ncbi:MAG: hypothetical protein HYY01_11810 [Chloroflexi bacterium]|nr:hypothetical protein [Chloroflexota bacterium]
MAWRKTATIIAGALALLALGMACSPVGQPAGDEGARTPMPPAGTPQEGATLPGPPTPTPGTPAPPPADAASQTALPSGFQDSVNLAAYPSVAGVVIGEVLGKVGEPAQALSGDVPGTVRYEDWLVRVERWLVGPQPYQEVSIRLIERFIRPDGSFMPARFPVTFTPGQRAVLFLSRNLGSAHSPLSEEMFTLRLGPGGEGVYVIREGAVYTVRHGMGGQEPVEDFIRRIIEVAKQAGRATGAEPAVEPTAKPPPGVGSPGATTPPTTPAPMPRLADAMPVRIGRQSAREFYTPGDAIDLTLTVTNVSNASVDIQAFPENVTLYPADTPRAEEVVVASGGGPRRLAPGESAILNLTVPGEVSATLPLGRYTVNVGVRFTDGTGAGAGGGIIFVLLPPQGALEKTVVVNEVREAEGVRITLRQIEFTQRQTRIVSIAVPPGYTPPEGPVSFPRGNMAGKYRVDGGPWRELHAAYRDTQEGVHLEWTLGPVPADAKVFEFAVTQFAINPSHQVGGLWEWTVSLLEEKGK